MAITVSEALQHSGSFYAVHQSKPVVIELRRNGAIQTWKRDTSRVEIPVKIGMYEYHRLQTGDLGNVFLTADAAQAEIDRVHPNLKLEREAKEKRRVEREAKRAAKLAQSAS